MKLVTIDKLPNPHVGVLVGNDTVLDLAALKVILPEAYLVPNSMRKILEAGVAGMETVAHCLAQVDSMADDEKAILTDAGILSPLAELPLLAPVPNPKLILSVGLNYWKHLEEMAGTPTPKHPAAFIKTRDSLSGSGNPIYVPPQCPDMIDYEGELCFVFGRQCHNVQADEAMSYVAGYTIANDVSARNWVGEVFASSNTFPAIHAWERNINGKQLPGFTPCGPVLVTKDEVKDPNNLQMTLTLNGEVMQSTKTDDMIFKLPELISYFSQWYQFNPGDIVTTGSPAGVGFGRDPKVFMKPGDVVEVEVEGIGKLSNTVVESN
ncbi:MAG: fumarylacetoacetate hydrolase family protein [Rhodospirillales bacterium]|jgi:acylpyruvate hydrolase